MAAPEARPAASRALSYSATISLSFLLLVLALVVAGRIPMLVLGAYLLLSVWLFILYGIDKSAARRGAWRVPESMLHLVALLGGWPGALVARSFFRHKTIKQPFCTTFWATVGINCAALAAVVAMWHGVGG